MQKQATATTGSQSIKLYSIEEVQDQLSISRPTVNRLIAAKIIPTIRIGRAVRISETALIDLISSGGNRHIQA